MSDAELRLAVTDTGPDPTVIRSSGEGGGYGLIGLSERAALLRGTLRAGPRGSGWQLVLTLPPPRGVPDEAGSRPDQQRAWT